MVTTLARIYKSLENVDFKILSILDSLLDKFEYVPLEVIERRCNLNPKELSRRLDKLHRLRTVRRSTSPKIGYKLTYLGLDCLALHALARKDIIAFLGSKIGMGKESEIYLAKTPDNKLVAVKFYKIGRISFQKVKRVRSYVVDESNWLIRSKIAAEREFNALRDLVKYTDYVPNVWGWNRHAVVIDYIEGIELYRYRDAFDPLGMLTKIMTVIREAYLKLGIVHGDLSEYNIIVHIRNNIETPYIIDWPQYIYRDDPQSLIHLKRDVEYIIKFFKRRYRTSLDYEVALKYVMGEIDELSVESSDRS